jgi:transmembrane carrier protein
MEGLFGLIGNTISTTSVHPIDVIKTNYQLSRTRTHLSATQIGRNIWKNRGMRGFYSGLIPNLGTYPIFWGVYFATSQALNERQILSNKYGDKFVKSYGAGLIASGLTNPLFVLKTRMQNVDGNTSLIKTVRQTNKIGYRAYFRGLSSTYLNNMKLGIQFPLYDFIKDHTDSVLAASMGSKIISSSVLYPLDLIRVNQRASDKHLGLMEVGRSVYKKSGVRGLYRGALLYNLVTTPNFVIMMMCVEFMRKTFKDSY